MSYYFFFFFFFKQKTAYELRISDWSSDVCSSDLLYDRVPLVTRAGVETQIQDAVSRKPGARLRFEDMVDDSIVKELDKSGFIDKDRKRVVEGKSVSVRVDLGGRGIIKTKKKPKTRT